jgi:hypothetical protein
MLSVLWLRSAVLVSLATSAIGSPRSLAVTAQRYELADHNSSAFLTELDNKPVVETLNIDPHSTALVLIDVWDDSSSAGLSDNEEKRLLPLLGAARALGMLIIHAPSEAPEWPKISVLPGEILVTGQDGHPGSSSRCDTPILNSTRKIKHVLMAGYDTNKCVVDKPCGAVALSTELYASGAKVVLVRDATRGEYGWYGNAWYGQHATLSMLELGWWLPGHEGLASMLLADLLVAAGAQANASALEPLNYPSPSAALTSRNVFPPVPKIDSTVALVVVSCSSDYANQGFRARVMDNRDRYLEPILAAWRENAGLTSIIHSPNGHTPDGACSPRLGEEVVTSNEQFDQLLQERGIKRLYDVGYAANTDMMFGVGGQQRFYSRQRYLSEATPSYFWIEEATIGVESAETLANHWAKRAALAYRQPLLRASRPYYHNVVTSEAVLDALCAAAPSGGAALYVLPGMHTIKSAGDAIERDVARACGPSMTGHSEVTMQLDAVPATLDATIEDHKLLCFAKSVGTPFAVYQLKIGTNGTLMYQTASSSGWTGTLTAPGFFAAANVSLRVTVVHAGASVAIYRNGSLVASSDSFAQLDYSDATALLIGKRTDAEVWNGKLGNVLIRNGSWHPRVTSRLPPAELAALKDLHDSCGGAKWKYRLGTDAVGGGAAWLSGDPCSSGWFGVKCDANGSHVSQLFPNTRFSGNELDCVLPSSIGDFAKLEHLYTSNDRTPSNLHGPIPTAIGKLTELKCLYFSHNNLSGRMPTELQGLTKLQVFLMRCNQLSGPLIDFTKLPLLRNVWFDTNEGLTGTLAGLGRLTQLTFLQASHIPGLGGAVPLSLCNLKCDAAATNVTCSASLPKGCCGIASCGAAPPAPPPPPSTMGECFPQ